MGGWVNVVVKGWWARRDSRAAAANLHQYRAKSRSRAQLESFAVCQKAKAGGAPALE